jgi:hypothetical protein
MTKIIYCKTLEEYIKLIVEKELIGNNEKTIIKLNDKKNKIKI